MFKCMSSSICIAKDTVCDSVNDCPFTDDEMFCKMSKGHQTCSSKCSCLLLTVFCDGQILKERKRLNPYIGVILNKVRLTDVQIFYSFGTPILVRLLSCNLSNICMAGKKLKTLRILHVSFNEVKILTRNCFEFVSNINELSVKGNIIFSVLSYAFYSSRHISELDMSFNNLTQLRDKTFAGLHDLLFLNIIGNPIVSLHWLVFLNTTILNIETEKYKVCCVKPLDETNCTTLPPWPHSCNRLLSSTLVQMAIWLVGSIGMSLNICALIAIRQKLLPSGDAHNCAIRSLSVSDLLHSGEEII